MRTDDEETAQGERVASITTSRSEREERVENMMETERKLREKTETLEAEQARKETEERRTRRKRRRLKSKGRKCSVTRKWLDGENVEKTDEEARRLFEQAAKREDAKVKLKLARN